MRIQIITTLLFICLSFTAKAGEDFYQIAGKSAMRDIIKDKFPGVDLGRQVNIQEATVRSDQVNGHEEYTMIADVDGHGGRKTLELKYSPLKWGNAWIRNGQNIKINLISVSVNGQEENLDDRVYNAFSEGGMN